jgi:hypothetical protein
MGGMRKTLAERISQMTASEFAADIRAVSAASQRFQRPKPDQSFPNAEACREWLATNSFRRGK